MWLPGLGDKEGQRANEQKESYRKDKSKKDKAQDTFTEKIQRIFTKHRVGTVVKPQTTVRQVLVHPKDKVEKQKKAGVVYKIPCSQCEKVYIGETGDSWEPGSQNTERKQKRSLTEISQDPPAELLPMNTMNQP